ncbi:MAG: hypothetical protein V3U84_11060, partial [Thiotrichaceae bacterium]
QLMRIFTSLLLVTIVTITASCTKNPPKLESSKQLVYSFKQPQRTVLPGSQSKQLGQPSMKSITARSSTYYSANGNICRRLSNRRTVCHIGGKWFESVRIRTKGL